MQGDESQWMIIWNNNNAGKQTADMSFTMRGLYSMNGYQSKVTTLCEGGSTGEDPNPNPNPNPDPETNGPCLASADEQVVFFKAPNGFGTSASVYMWIDGTNTHLVGSWPGSPATHLGDGIFKFALPTNMQGDESQWMIIWNNNGNGLQTADLKFTMRGMYTTNSDIQATSCTSVVDTLCDNPSTNVEQSTVTLPSVYKVLIDGKLYIILENGRMLDIWGNQVKF
jgi:hypothetical protein